MSERRVRVGVSTQRISLWEGECIVYRINRVLLYEVFKSNFKHSSHYGFVECDLRCLEYRSNLATSQIVGSWNDRVCAHRIASAQSLLD